MKEHQRKSRQTKFWQCACHLKSPLVLQLCTCVTILHLCNNFALVLQFCTCVTILHLCYNFALVLHKKCTCFQPIRSLLLLHEYYYNMKKGAKEREAGISAATVVTSIHLWYSRTLNPLRSDSILYSRCYTLPCKLLKRIYCNIAITLST